MSDTHDGQHERFLAARRYERELTSRQRDILRMLAAGKSNPEIAATYDITPDGAKWHVSEIYSKLGLASREEAAAYWHWRNRIGQRAAAFARALVPAAIPLKYAAAAIAGLGIIGAVIAALLVTGNDDEPAALRYAATITYFTDNEPTGFRVELAYKDSHHFNTRVFDGDTLQYAMTVNGPDAYTYSGDTPQYYRRIDSTFLDGVEGQPGIVVPTGAIAGRYLADSIAASAEMIRSFNSSPNAFATVAGKATILGRSATNITTGPAGSSQSISTNSQGTPVINPVTEVGVTQVWVDDETMIILRWDSPDGDGHTVRAEVTALDLSPLFTGDTFVFVAPPGATLDTRTPEQIAQEKRDESGRSDLSGSPIPAGFLGITELPDGLDFKSVSVIGNQPAASVRQELTLADLPHNTSSPVLLSINQVQRDLHTIPPLTGDPVALPYARAATILSEPDGLVLSIELPLVDVTIRTGALTRDELLAWAATLELH